jgi:hypothetical protein
MTTPSGSTPTIPTTCSWARDGGLYETFDRGESGASWRTCRSPSSTGWPVDDAEPFYNVYGGTQDNNTQGGPSRTTSPSGRRNRDWFVTLGGDGFEPAIEPGNPDIVYSQWQHGNLNRFDRGTGEPRHQARPGRGRGPQVELGLGPADQPPQPRAALLLLPEGLPQ